LRFRQLKDDRMDDANEWGPVASAVLEEIDDVVERRLAAFRDSLQEWLSGILAGPIPDDWGERLEQFVEHTAEQGLSIAPASIDAIARIIESWISATDDAVSQSLTRKARSRIVDGAFVQSVIPSASGPSVLSRVAKSRPSTTTHHIRLGDYTDATQAVIKTLGSKWKYVSTDAMNRVRAAGALVDGQTGAVLGGDANSLGAEAFVRLEHRNGVIDTAHFRFVWTGSEPEHWQLVEIVRGATPERKAAELAAREKIRHDDVMRVRSGINRGQGGMFAIVGGIGGIVEGAPLLGTLEALGGAEQVGLAGLDVATGKEHRAWSARAVQAVLEGVGVDAETAQFLADHGGLLIALGRATAEAAGTAHAVIETSTGYRIRLEFDPATLSANGLGGAKIKMEKLARTTGKNTGKPGRSSGASKTSTPNGRTTHRESEIDVEAKLEKKGFQSQRSYKKGQEVPRGTKGSSRPDLDKPGVSVEVKNYKIDTPRGRAALVRKVIEQAKQRVINLPRGTRQEIRIDIRGQKIPRGALGKIVSDIVDKSKGIITTSDIVIEH
jgi:hypothetical protein